MSARDLADLADRLTALGWTIKHDGAGYWFEATRRLQPNCPSWETVLLVRSNGVVDGYVYPGHDSMMPLTLKPEVWDALNLIRTWQASTSTEGRP